MLLIELVDRQSNQPSELRSARAVCYQMFHKTNKTEKATCFRFSLFNLNIILSNGKIKSITEKQVESLLTSKLTNLKSSSVID